jgi:hypothetical protein
MKKTIAIVILIMLVVVLAFKKMDAIAGQIMLLGAGHKIVDEVRRPEITKSIEKPKEEILKFTDVPKRRTDLGDDTVYNDVTSRQSNPFGERAGRSTNVHRQSTAYILN